MKKIILAGGTGFIGEYLSQYFLKKNYQIVLLTRQKKESDHPQIQYVCWDAKKKGPWVQALEGVDLLVNLVGKSVNCRYTKKNKKEILASRIDSTKVLGEAILQLEQPPLVWMNSSTATIYRHAEDRAMDEESGETGSDFSMSVAQAWEKVFFDAVIPSSVRRVALRISIVLGKSGGAYPAYENLVKFYLGGKQGSGKQKVSWIHIEDLARAIDFILSHPELSGCVNLSAPYPLSNSEFMRTLRKNYRKKFGLPAAEWMLKLGALFLGTEPELLLKSRWVLPKRLLDAGFKFEYETLEKAAKQISERSLIN